MTKNTFTQSFHLTKHLGLEYQIPHNRFVLGVKGERKNQTNFKSRPFV